MGDFVISPLPRLLTKELCAAGPLCSTGVAPFQRYYGPSRHRLVFDRFPGASGYAVYLAPSISRRDEDGFSSCLACPCHRAVPTTPPEGCASSDTLATHPVAFVRHEKTRPLGSIFLSGPPMGSLVLRPGDSLTILKMALSVSFIRLVSSTNRDSSYRALTFSPVGLSPTEHASLRWTHSCPKTQTNSRPLRRLGPGANIDTKLLIYGLLQKGRGFGTRRGAALLGDCSIRHLPHARRCRFSRGRADRETTAPTPATRALPPRR